MKFIIFGASGGTGKLIVTRLLEKGYSVKAVLRSPEQADELPSGTNVLIGSPLDQNFVSSAIQKDDIVISAIGQTRKTRSPISALVSPKDVIEKSIQNISYSCTKSQAKAFIFISAYGSGPDWLKLPLWMRMMIQLTNVKYAYLDHARAESHLVNFKLPLIIIKPVLLIDGPEFNNPKVVTGEKVSPLAKINRNAIARYVADMNWNLLSSKTIELVGE
jgi:nucleoside-diphosphate-sugar epimerase